MQEKNGYVIIAIIDIDNKKIKSLFYLFFRAGAFSESPFSAKGPLSRMCRTYLETGSGTDR